MLQTLAVPNGYPKDVKESSQLCQTLFHAQAVYFCAVLSGFSGFASLLWGGAFRSDSALHAQGLRRCSSLQKKNIIMMNGVRWRRSVTLPRGSR